MNHSQTALVHALVRAHPQAANPPADLPAADDPAPACGWFDSSWELRQGLAVTELPDSDGSAAALWFAALAETTVPTLALQ